MGRLIVFTKSCKTMGQSTRAKAGVCGWRVVQTAPRVLCLEGKETAGEEQRTWGGGGSELMGVTPLHLCDAGQITHLQKHSGLILSEFVFTLL